MGFDLGAQPWSFMSTPSWFVSHTHLDHIAACRSTWPRRRMMKMEPPTIYMPAEAIEPVERMPRRSAARPGPAAVELCRLKPGDEVELSRELVVTAFPTGTRSPRWAFWSGSGGRSSNPSITT